MFNTKPRHETIYKTWLTCEHKDGMQERFGCSNKLAVVILDALIANGQPVKVLIDGSQVIGKCPDAPNAYWGRREGHAELDKLVI